MSLKLVLKLASIWLHCDLNKSNNFTLLSDKIVGIVEIVTNCGNCGNCWSTSGRFLVFFSSQYIMLCSFSTMSHLGWLLSLESGLLYIYFLCCRWMRACCRRICCLVVVLLDFTAVSQYSSLCSNFLLYLPRWCLHAFPWFFTDAFPVSACLILSRALARIEKRPVQKI